MIKYFLFVLFTISICAQSSLLRIYDSGLSYNGNELINNPPDRGFELGIELVFNTNFVSDTWWTKGTGVTISGGTANFTNAAQYAGVTKLNICTVGKKYKTKFTVLNYTAGNALIGIGSATGIARISSGTYIQDIIASVNGNLFVGTYSAAGIANYSIDDVSFRETNLWLNAGNHSIDTSSTYKQIGTLSGKLVATGAGNGTTNTISLASTLFTAVTNGTNYRFQVYAYTSTASTTLTFKLGDITLTSIVPTSGMSVINFDFKATASTIGNIILYLDKAATVYLDEVSLKSGQ